MRPCVAFVMLGLLFVSALPSSPAAAPDDPVARGLTFVAAAQDADGGWGTRGPYVVEAAGVAGLDVKRWPTSQHSAWNALAQGTCRITATTLPVDARDCEYKLLLRRVHAVGVAGYDPRAMPGMDGVAAVREGFVGGQFGDPRFVSDDMFAILALRAAGIQRADPQIQAAAQNIREAQREDGAWSENTVGGAPSVDVTGFALSALKAAGTSASDPSAARAYVLGQWRSTGAFGNVQNTVWGIHALSALGALTNDTALTFLQTTQDAEGRIGSDHWSTSEAVIPLAGGRYPLPGYAPATIITPPAHARENVTLRAAAPFASLQVTWDDGVVASSRSFDAADTYAYRYLARGPEVIARGEGTLAVHSARPQVGPFPTSIEILRMTPVTFDLQNASDPDGTIVAFEIDWGDGNVTENATHRYARPGAYNITIRVRDDTGVWSHPTLVRAHVENRPPVLEVPASLVGDRASDLRSPTQTLDPDGDDVRIKWRYGGSIGEGIPRFRPSALGAHVLFIEAIDAFGATTFAEIPVEIVNLAPTLAIVVDGADVHAEVSDRDGPSPTVVWFVDGAPATPPIRLPPGAHEVRALATDADGAHAETTARVHVPADDTVASRPTQVAPEVVRFEAALTDDTLRASFELRPATAHARVLWRSDVGEGAAPATSPFEVPLAGARWATATLVVENDGLEARHESALLVAPVDARQEGHAAPSPVSVIVAPKPLGVEVIDEKPVERTSVSAAIPTRETPGAPWPLALLLAAMLERRARSA